MYKNIVILLFVSVSSLHGQNKPQVAFILKERDLIPEGITYDAVGKNFYVGSIHKQKIVQISEKGVVSDFVKQNQGGILEVLGMKVDEQRRQLWVCNNSPGHDTSQRTSNIHIYDLTNGTLVKKYQIKERKKHLFNDVVLATSGDAYITDSDGGAIYCIKKDGDSLEEFIKAGALRYPNGITLTPDEKSILVSTGGGLGIVAIDLDTKVIKLIASERYLMIGIDGLYRHGTVLIGVQNVTFPEGIIKLTPKSDFSTIEKIDFLSVHDPRFDLPTTGVIAEGYFYFIANSQLLQTRTNDGSLKDASALKDVLIMRVKL